MKLEKISEENISALVSLMLELWPSCEYEEELENAQEILGKDTQTVFLVKFDGAYLGFIYLSLRFEYVEGTNSQPVAYVEGIYLKPAFRRQGIGRQLLKKAEQWAQAKGCTEMASDTELHNQGSIDFHRGAGFEEVNRIVCFRKFVG